MSAHPLDVQITTGPTGVGQLVIGGHDISNLATSVRVDLAAHELPEVTIDVIPQQVALALSGADVRLSRDVHTLLEALGWTPPRGES